MALTKIVKGMLGSESVTPDNIVNTSTYTVGGLVSNGNISATGNATVGGSLSIASTLSTTAGIGLHVDGVFLGTATNLLYYNPTTKEVSYAGPGPSSNPFNQTLNTNSNVTFASVTIGSQTLGGTGTVLTVAGLTATNITVNRTLIANTGSFNNLNVALTATWYAPTNSIPAVRIWGSNLDAATPIGTISFANGGSSAGGGIIKGDLRQIRSENNYGLQLYTGAGDLTVQTTGLGLVRINTTATIFSAGKLLPAYTGSFPTPTVASVDIGAAQLRFNTIFAKSLNVLNNTIYFEDEAGTTTSTLSLTSGVVNVNGTDYVDQPVTTGSTPSFASLNADTSTFTTVELTTGGKVQDVGGIGLVAAAGSSANIASNDGNQYVWVDDTYAYISTNWNVDAKNWTFDRNGNMMFPDGTIQTTAYTGGDNTNFESLTAVTATITNLTVLGTMTTLNVTTENVTTENIVTQNYADGTSQTTAWTGTVADSQITSVSTSKVNGLSVVGWTNNYNDLINKPAIPSPFDLSTVTNQALFTTSTVTFQHVRTANTLTFAGAVARMAGVRLASFVTPGVSSNILFYNTTTGETGWFPGPNQSVSTSSVVSFTGVTTTNITVKGNIVFNDATTQGTTGQTSVYARNALPSGTTGRIITISDSGSDLNAPAGNFAPAYWDPDATVWTYIGNSNSVTPI